MKRIVTGIVAHVDAGKTTLSEALLYATGTTRALGRVDHGDSFLDTDAMERARGITIYTEPAIIETDGAQLTLLDTPGHVDFAAEMERTLQVLDYAILVVSAPDGVQGHTQTLWRLLRRYEVPTFVFVNKTDAPGVDRVHVLQELHERFSDACIDFTGAAEGTLDDAQLEQVAMQDETAMEEYLSDGTLSPSRIRSMVADRLVVPVFFGAALRMEGIDDFLRGFVHFTREPEYPAQFGARVFKISHDTQGNRLTWLKVTGGELRAKMLLPEGDGEEKVDQVRRYSGAKFTTIESTPAGTVCAVTGPERTFPGEGLGSAQDAARPELQPVLTYTVDVGDLDSHHVLLALRELEDEDPLLHVVWDPRLQEIRVQLMGAVQLEVVEQLMRERFKLPVTFDAGSILYQETITEPVEGVGHFEPLRHYAEVHLLLEPLPQGGGLEFASDVSVNDLDVNWQRLVLQHLREREHLGVLVGAPVTDMRISLIAGRGHLKHTEGGDFRQATYRALRQGLMEARAGVPTEASVEEVADRFVGDGRDDTDDDAPAARIQGAGNCRLLEPWYRFRLELPQDMVGRAMSDVQRMGGTSEPPTLDGAYAVLEGDAPVSGMRDYAMEVNAYAHGEGRLSVVFAGYRAAHDEAAVVEAAHYEPEVDLEHTPDSVFCAHGAGYPVKWYQVPRFAHVAMRE
ncbi:elongation factor G [Bifidobacterium cuniculi]|uniref:Translation elongation factor n=1 Tax=Bifidobacterium cuniculi TaxID=1688 RepID=A0A087AT54_9BIFI|nr:TetM/TetW/TetO/TetS family tetracycline resistance ribosomal protection protein [Bifidobacterium cuniculi]KFI61954.1 translation elongation factor [Bifidobacterium cuniculi]